MEIPIHQAAYYHNQKLREILVSVHSIRAQQDIIFGENIVFVLEIKKRNQEQD